MFNRRDFLKGIGAGAGMLALSPLIKAAGDAAPPAKRPNFIFILTDDMGWSDAKAFGHPYVKSPNLDRFTAESTRFTQFYVANPVCSPSRTAFMTGHYPARHQIHGHFATHEINAERSMPDWLGPKVPMLPRMLKRAGYRTAHFGKWHLGDGAGAPEPKEYGFDVYRTNNANGPKLGEEEVVEYFKSQGQAMPANPGGIEAKYPFYRAQSTRMIVDETLKFIKENKDQPFYVNAWTLIPHAPLKPTPEQLAVYQDLTPDPHNPAFGKWCQEYLSNAADLKSQMQIFLATLTDLDTQLGRLFDGLKEMGVAENTVIFFSSDNGPEDYRVGNASNAGVGTPGPFRGRKRSLYEGGIRSEFLVRWPGQVAAGREEKDAVIGSVDFLPTVCALAGFPLPAGAKPDGEDVSDILRGASRPRKGPLYWEWLFEVWGPDYTPPQIAVRDGKWKLLLNPDRSRVELYDIPTDREERKDVAADNPQVVEALAQKAVEWQKTLPSSPQRAHIPNAMQGPGGTRTTPAPKAGAGQPKKGKAKARGKKKAAPAA